MSLLIIEKMKNNNEINLSTLLQLIASISWIASVFVYGSFGLGDYLQLIAATAWTLSNIFSLLWK